MSFLRIVNDSPKMQHTTRKQSSCCFILTCFCFVFLLECVTCTHGYMKPYSGCDQCERIVPTPPSPSLTQSPINKTPRAQGTERMALCRKNLFSIEWIEFFMFMAKQWHLRFVYKAVLLKKSELPRAKKILFRCLFLFTQYLSTLFI